MTKNDRLDELQRLIESEVDRAAHDSAMVLLKLHRAESLYQGAAFRHAMSERLFKAAKSIRNVERQIQCLEQMRLDEVHA